MGEVEERGDTRREAFVPEGNSPYLALRPLKELPDENI